RKFTSLIEEFDKTYKELVEDIEDSCSVSDNWENLESLIKKHFG
ncbi:unnamed protein product, partial [marine sediment metagenome]